MTRRFVDGNIIYLGNISNTDCAHYQASTNFYINIKRIHITFLQIFHINFNKRNHTMKKINN